MEPKMAIFPALSQDREHVIIELQMDGKPLGHIKLDSSETEKFINNIAGFRSQLNEPVIPDLDPGYRLTIHPNPSMIVHTLADGATRVLGLRHPGLGWLGFSLQGDMAQKLAGLLSKPQT